MGKEERKLTESELRRKERTEKLCGEMEQKGYEVKTRTVGVLQANILAIVVMLPFVLLIGGLYFWNGGGVELVLGELLLLIPALVVLVVAHEAIHGLTWALTGAGAGAIEFGVIWSALTPYCTCSRPMKRWQYLLGVAMPTLLLGFGIGAAGVAGRSYFWFALGEIMTLAGGGDFLILLKLLGYRPGGREAIYLDHPYEVGFIVFER